MNSLKFLAPVTDNVLFQSTNIIPGIPGATLASSPRLGLSLGQVDGRHGEEGKEEHRPGYHGVRQPNGLGRIRGPSF